MSALSPVVAGQQESLAARIRSEVEAAERDWGSALAHAIRAGELLIEAKADLQHGEWLPWLEANFDFTRQMATNYMRLSENAEELQMENALSISAALKQLASGSREPSLAALQASAIALKQVARSRGGLDAMDAQEVAQVKRAAEGCLDLAQEVQLRAERGLGENLAAARLG